MAELKFDSTEIIIELDKPYLYFNIDPSPIQDNTGLYGKSDFTMVVKNKSNSFVAIRTKTTKKEVYAVNPTYGIIVPQGTLDIKFVYHIKDLNEDPKKHKFKFEGIVVEKSMPEKEVKSYFDQVLANKTTVRGNAIKSEVVFNYVNYPTQPDQPNQGNQFKEIIPNLSASQSMPVINQQSEFSNIIDKIKLNEEEKNVPLMKSSTIAEVPKQKPIVNDRESEQLLQDLKMDYQKYKNQLVNLKETYNSLKNRVEMEKTKDTVTNFQTSVSTSSSEEKQISKKIAIILVVCSIILGFILAR